ncbi:methyl-accepting chemotaxis protein [Marinobacter bryozoorum]|uniref:methyl-accepting chemotaxis protein n=1 Tax=Marinobacter bryozoorum TaxID=256324 RepID=UPI002003B665|nr:methyl-accepting chemotaxis protein [Marinobacter bryozoorum]MCK7544391.1 methyl-accepting chemotaxis protein [Marinobacter bryozoorum]
MFGRLTVAGRLGLGFGVVLSLMVLVSVVGNLRVGFMDRTLMEVREGASVKQRHAINFRGSVHDRAIAIRDAVLVRNDTDLRTHLQNIEQLKAFYQKSAVAMDGLFDELGTSGEETRLLGDIEAIERRTLALTEQLVTLRQSEGPDAARAFLLGEVSPAYTEWLARVNAFIDHQEDIIAGDIDRVQGAASGFQVLIFIVTGLAILVGIVVVVLIIRNLKATLGAEPEDVAEAIRALADGQLDQAIDTRYPNSVMGALKETTTRLSATMARVRQASTQLAEAATELMDTAGNNREQIRLQSEEAQQMAAAVNQMAATVNEVAGFAGNAASATRTADEEVENGNRVVADTATAIGNLADTLEGATETVRQVSQDSANIESIIEVINGIAEQTNLLALNAAIEAARAGEQGRGFAVVADEVRSLATRTQDSTREIQEMIGKLQTGAGQAVSVMETSRELARETVAQTGSAQEALGRIRHEVGAINDMNAQIASAAEQQSSVAEEVNRNISRIHDATVETAAGSEQVASSSRELDTLADQLRKEVSFFRAGQA